MYVLARHNVDFIQRFLYTVYDTVHISVHSVAWCCNSVASIPPNQKSKSGAEFWALVSPQFLTQVFPSTLGFFPL